MPSKTFYKIEAGLWLQISGFNPQQCMVIGEEGPRTVYVVSATFKETRDWRDSTEGYGICLAHS